MWETLPRRSLHRVAQLQYGTEPMLTRYTWNILVCSVQETCSRTLSWNMLQGDEPVKSLQDLPAYPRAFVVRRLLVFVGIVIG